MKQERNMFREQILPNIKKMERDNLWYAYREVSSSDYFPNGNNGYDFGVHYGSYMTDHREINIGVEWFKTEQEQQHMLYELAYDGFVHIDMVYSRKGCCGVCGSSSGECKCRDDGDYVLDLMSRSTDDATAHPVFLALRQDTSISNGAYKYVYFDECDIDEFAVSFMADTIDLTNWYCEEDGFVSDERLDEYFEENGYEYHVDEDGTYLTYWSKDDKVKRIEVERVFWTREEADNYCEASSNRGKLYSYSVVAGGVLRELMDFTCEREIERVLARKENRKSKL
jgi:hypothetical protein